MTRTDDTPVPDYPGLLRLDGKRFVVLGAGQGIGRQASHALASVGARLACVDQEPDLASDIAAEVDATPLSGNAYDRDDMARMFGEAERALGGIDGVVDIIGMSRYADLAEMIGRRLELALRHRAAPCVPRHAVRRPRHAGARRRHGVRRVGVGHHVGAAPLGVRRGEGRAHVVGAHRCRRARSAGIRVNAVAPGVVWTPRVSAFLGDEGRERNIANTPLRRVAQPADIAAVLLFLASDLAAYVTGQTLAVDGGVGSKFPYPMADL